MFHVGFNENESDIELAYRLNKKYWSQRYTTELAKVLIEYGFSKLSLPKIIAAVHPANDRSRRVLEKVGMSYVGIIDFCGKLLPCYEIYNNKLDVSEIKLLSASINDYRLIQNMAVYYTYDMSEYMGWPQQDDGTQNTGIDYLKYWQANNTFIFIIKYQDEMAGFAIVDKDVSNTSNDFNIAQFFILRKFKGRGLGRHIAFQIFDKFCGRWEVFVMPHNEGAYRFWRKIIKEYTQQQYREYTRKVGLAIRNVFEFSSRKL